MTLKQGGVVSGNGIGTWASSSVLWRQGLSWVGVTNNVLAKMESVSVVPSVMVSISTVPSVMTLISEVPSVGVPMPTASIQPSTLAPLSLG